MGSSSLLFEAVFVGVTLASCLSLAVSLYPRTVTTGYSAAVLGFCLGAGLHLGFELIGLNKTYCVSGHACRPQLFSTIR